MQTGLNNERVRSHNRRATMEYLYRKRLATKSELAHELDLSIPAISKILDSLENSEMVEQKDAPRRTRGLSGGTYRVRPESWRVLCMNVSPIQIEACLADNCIAPLGDPMRFAIAPESPAQLVDEIVRVYEKFRAEAGDRRIRIAIGLHGHLNPQTGVSIIMPHAPWRDSIPLKATLEHRLSTEVLIDNDCVLLALAEKWFNPAQATEFCVINFDYGIGSSFVIQDEVYRGVVNGAGQIGHTQIDPDGLQCTCQRYGCLETVASLTAMLKAYRKRLKASEPSRQIQRRISDLTIDDLIDRYRANDPEAVAIVDAGIDALGLSIYNLLNIVNINRIYIYGRGVAFGPSVLERINAKNHLNPFDIKDQKLLHTTNVQFGMLSRRQQLLGIGYLFIEKTLHKIEAAHPPIHIPVAPQ